jgi:hypothetical protein
MTVCVKNAPCIKGGNRKAEMRVAATGPDADSSISAFPISGFALCVLVASLIHRFP